jgi:hypothetical protein
MATSEPVHDADALATIIPFRPRRSTMAPHPSFGTPEPDPSATTIGPGSQLRPTPMQLSFFENSLNP